METAIRTKLHHLLLSRFLRTPVNAGKSPHAPGSDVQWKELAEMYAELGRDLHDEFLSPFAAELRAT